MPLQLKVHHLGKKRSLAVRETDPIDAVKLSVQRLLGFRPAAVLIDGMDLTEGNLPVQWVTFNVLGLSMYHSP